MKEKFPLPFQCLHFNLSLVFLTASFVTRGTQDNLRAQGTCGGEEATRNGGVRVKGPKGTLDKYFYEKEKLGLYPLTEKDFM